MQMQSPPLPSAVQVQVQRAMIIKSWTDCPAPLVPQRSHALWQWMHTAQHNETCDVPRGERVERACNWPFMCSEREQAGRTQWQSRQAKGVAAEGGRGRGERGGRNVRSCYGAFCELCKSKEMWIRFAVNVQCGVCAIFLLPTRSRLDSWTNPIEIHKSRDSLSRDPSPSCNVGPHKSNFSVNENCKHGKYSKLCPYVCVCV